MKDVLVYFDHMEKVVYGTRFVPLEYDIKIGHAYGYDSEKPCQCPKCLVGFRYYKKAKEIICPWCDFKFREDKKHG